MRIVKFTYTNKRLVFIAQLDAIEQLGSKHALKEAFITHILDKACSKTRGWVLDSIDAFEGLYEIRKRHGKTSSHVYAQLTLPSAIPETLENFPLPSTQINLFDTEPALLQKQAW